MLARAEWTFWDALSIRSVYSFGVRKLSSDEARRIGKAIARITEFMMPRQDLCPLSRLKQGFDSPRERHISII